MKTQPLVEHIYTSFEEMTDARALSQGGLCREAFGAKYGPGPAPEIDPAHWEFDSVSQYAASETREDFVATFMLFMIPLTTWGMAWSQIA